MIVIYTQDNTIIRNDADSAKGDLIDLYGEKLGTEAYAAMKNGRIGSAYRKYGGPFAKVVSREDAARIMEKESAVGINLFFG